MKAFLISCMSNTCRSRAERVELAELDDVGLYRAKAVCDCKSLSSHFARGISPRG